MSPPITHHTQLGESLRLDCVPPRSFPPARFEWALTNSEGRIEPVNYDNRITMDFEGLHLHTFSLRSLVLLYLSFCFPPPYYPFLDFIEHIDGFV